MTAVTTRAALEQALAAITPTLATVYENEPYTPTVGTPFQRVTILFAQPDNREIGSGHVEQGFMQVNLAYPKDAGAGAAIARAEAIRTALYRGRTLTNSGEDTTITNTPEIAPGFIDADHYTVPVRVRFRSFNP